MQVRMTEKWGEMQVEWDFHLVRSSYRGSTVRIHCLAVIWFPHPQRLHYKTVLLTGYLLWLLLLSQLLLNWFLNLFPAGQYYCYSTCPFVLFLKEKFSEWLFIVLHCIVCVSPSSVEPTVEEYFILVLFCGMTLNEYQQYKKSPVKYFK